MRSFICLIFLAALTSCGFASPDAGHEVVLIKKPMIFGHGGIEPDPVKAGRTIIALTTQDIDVNMQPEQFKEHFDDLMSSDGVPLSFDAYIRVQVTNSVLIISKFGPKWYENNLQAAHRNFVRQAVRKRGMNETAISTTAIEAIDGEVFAGLVGYVEKIGLPVRIVNTTVGKANPPDSVKHQRVETATQEQRVNTEVQRKLAEDSRKAAETSRAAADNAYRQALGMSTEQFIALEQIKMLGEVCAKSTCTFVQNGGASPVFDVRK